VILAAAALAAAAAGCADDGGGAQDPQQQVYVMAPDFPDVAGAVGTVPGVVAYAEGFDRSPEFAKSARCVALPGRVVGQLQLSGTPPAPAAVRLRFHDRAGDRTFSARAGWEAAKVERSEDVRTGRLTIQLEAAAPGFAPDVDSVKVGRPGDCVLTIVGAG
jgi:hypothetical protein